MLLADVAYTHERHGANDWTFSGDDHTSIVAWGCDTGPGLLVPRAECVALAALKKVRRVVLVIKGSRDMGYVLIDHHKSILTQGSDIARALA